MENNIDNCNTDSQSQPFITAGLSLTRPVQFSGLGVTVSFFSEKEKSRYHKRFYEYMSRLIFTGYKTYSKFSVSDFFMNEMKIDGNAFCLILSDMVKVGGANVTAPKCRWILGVKTNFIK